MSVARPIEPRSRWPWISLIPLGLGAWAPIYAGVRARRWTWILLGLVWCVVVVGGFVKSSTGAHPGHDNTAGMLLIVGWVGAIASSFVIRPAYERQMSSPLLTATEEARERLQERSRAQQLARENPTLALEMGVGRPDKPGASDAGLVDLNNASVAALSRLPGVDDALATKIAETRTRIGGFSSLEDLGTTLNLDGDVVERLRGLVVCLPRQQPA
jgi:DNA uptake protein ComE-like DNA-binding protein